MRPVLAAVEQQQQFAKGIQAEGRQHTAQLRQACASLRETNLRQAAQITELTTQNQQLGRGLRLLAKMAGVEQHVAAAMFRTADVQNPAQPIPEPPAVPPSQTTVDAETPEAKADVQTPGMVGGSTQDVAADATSTVYNPGMDVDAPALHDLHDVTAPVAGTQEPQPLNTVRTETDVRVGNPMNPQVGFPLRGPFQNGQRLNTGASVNDGSTRTFASLRLAKARLATGTAQGEEMAIAEEINKDASLSTEAIEREIATLANVQKAASHQRTAAQQNPAARSLVPRARTVPSMQGTGVPHTAAPTAGSVTDIQTADADLFV